MSGLAVVYHRDQRPASLTALRAMLDAVPYRGPDGIFTGAFGSVALGHARFAVTPEEEDEQQPLVSRTAGCALIADVRLDNREDLLAQLAEPAAAKISDARLILLAYEAWGLDAFARLIGDFAVIIWDPRLQRLVCARDTSGQRSLFYRLNQRTFAAASEIHQLLQDASVPVAPNEERLRDYLVPVNMWRNEPDHAATFYVGIEAVPAGHLLVVDRTTKRLRPYWELKPQRELRYRTDAEYVDHFRQLLFDVVRSRLRSAHRVGAMLSGGLDSASLVCVAQELYRAGRAVDHGFVSFSLVYPGLDCDESSFVRDVEAKYGQAKRHLPATELVSALCLSPRGFMRGPDKYASELDAIYTAATQARVRVVISGEIGDSCLYGSPLIFDSLLSELRLRTLWRRLRSYDRIASNSLRKTVALYCLLPLLPLWLHRRLMAASVARDFDRYGGQMVPWWLSEAMRAELMQRNVKLGLAAERTRVFASPAREQEFRLLYPPEVSREPAGWPLEVWRPFADRRLHEFLLAIPPEQKFEPVPGCDDLYAGAKLILRRAMVGILPESIRTRTVKTHFASLFQTELQSNWPSYAAAFGPAGRSEIVARGYVDRAAFWSRLEALRGGEWGVDFMYVLRMMAVETWLRTLQLPRPELVRVPPRSEPTSTGIARAAMPRQEVLLGEEVIAL